MREPLEVRADRVRPDQRRAALEHDAVPLAVDARLELSVDRLQKVVTVVLDVEGEKVVPEFLQEECEPDRLADALGRVIGDTPERRRQIDAFARLDAIMEIGQIVPSARVAEVVREVIAARRSSG